MSEATSFRYVYLHGFGSRARSRKGVYLRDALSSHGVNLRLAALNVPSFGRQTFSTSLGAIDRQDDSTVPLRLVGSSMGGYLAARWAELNPGRVERLFLLCPGFDLPARIPSILSADEIRDWERQGTIEIDTAAWGPLALHWDFVVDARSHSAYPEVACPTRIMHGTRDDVVPIETSRRYAAARSHVDLVEVDDDHSLEGSLERLVAEVGAFFGLWQPR